MEIHNTMEDVVLRYLDEFLKAKKDICKCDQCRLDMACFALNKIRPLYVASGRGVVHTEFNKRQNAQNDIDVLSTISEAVTVISSTRRHENDKPVELKDDNYNDYGNFETEGNFFYNFSQIVGRVLDAENMLPLSDVKVELFSSLDNKHARMFSKRWKNPLTIVEAMKGIFNFWPEPVLTNQDGIQTDFQYSIRVSCEGYESLMRTFDIRVISSSKLKRSINKDNIYYLEDIYLSKETE